MIKRILKKNLPSFVFKIYNDIFGYFSYRVYKKMINNLKICKDVNTVLDIGGGGGLFSKLLYKKMSKENKGIKIVVIDLYSQKKVNSLNKKYNFLKFQYGNAEKLKFKKDQFDLVICKDVLHHCKYEKAIKEIRRVGKKYIIIEARRGDRYLDKYLENHNHFTLKNFINIINPKSLYYFNIVWPKSRIAMLLLSLCPILPKSKMAFMIGSDIK